MTDQRTNSCFFCMLIPLVLGSLLLAALYWYAKDSKAEQIENDLSLRSNQLLNDSQVGGAIVNMNWRDATLTGTAVSEERSTEIEKIVAALPGIRSVTNHLEIVKAEAVVDTEEVEIEPEPEIALAPEPKPVQEPQPTQEAAPEAQQQAVEELLQTLDLSGITFLFGEDEITSQGKLILDEIASILSDHPEFDVSIEGHTDNVGDDELNFQLSQQRAQSVLNYLSSNGIQTERLKAKGFGESNPISN